MKKIFQRKHYFYYVAMNDDASTILTNIVIVRQKTFPLCDMLRTLRELKGEHFIITFYAKVGKLDAIIVNRYGANYNYPSTQNEKKFLKRNKSFNKFLRKHKDKINTVCDVNLEELKNRDERDDWE